MLEAGGWKRQNGGGREREAKAASRGVRGKRGREKRDADSSSRVLVGMTASRVGAREKVCANEDSSLRCATDANSAARGIDDLGEGFAQTIDDFCGGIGRRRYSLLAGPGTHQVRGPDIRYLQGRRSLVAELEGVRLVAGPDVYGDAKFAVLLATPCRHVSAFIFMEGTGSMGLHCVHAHLDGHVS